MATATLATMAGIAVLLVLSAFFSGSETAMTAASRPRMHQLERRGNDRAAIVNALRRRREQVISAILLGNNLVNILASALATSVMISVFGDAGVVYATVAMTLLVLIFGEIMPKTYALHRADRTALLVAPVYRLMVAVLAPVTDVIKVVTDGTLRLFGVDLSRHEDLFERQSEELRGAIELHRGIDTSTEQERRMLRSILELSEVEVDKVMKHRKDVVMIDIGEPIDKIVDQVVASPYTRIPLYRDVPENIVGVLHAKVLLREVRARGGLEAIDLDVAAAKPWFIPDTTSLLDQLQAFRQRREHFALVVDEYGSLMGIVTLEDILEEIVGEISDEHDVVLVGVRPQRDGSYLVDGGVTIRDLNRRFEWDLPDEEAATIAGLVIDQAKVIPEVGQIFNFYGFRFEIVRRHRNQITSIRITPPAQESVIAAG